jgi:dihydrodipicolinate reductase
VSSLRLRFRGTTHIPVRRVRGYIKPDTARANILAALQKGAHVAVGTSGLTEADSTEIDQVARERQRGVLAVGNFALPVVLMQKFAEMAARLIPQSEILDYARDDKIDAPSGTARELAARLAQARSPGPSVPVEQTVGNETHGARLSVRLPGFVITAEVIFGMPDQEADHPSRRRQQCSPVRGWSTARDSERLYTGRCPSRAGAVLEL